MKLTDTAVCWQKGQKRQTGGDNMIVTSTFGQTIREWLAILRFTSLPFLTFEHGGKWYELKPTGISKRICGARKKDGSRCRSKALHRGSKCKFHGGLSTGARTPEGRARAIVAMCAGRVRWQAARDSPAK